MQVRQNSLWAPQRNDRVSWKYFVQADILVRWTWKREWEVLRLRSSCHLNGTLRSTWDTEVTAISLGFEVSFSSFSGPRLSVPSYLLCVLPSLSYSNGPMSVLSVVRRCARAKMNRRSSLKICGRVELRDRVYSVKVTDLTSCVTSHVAERRGDSNQRKI